MKFLLLRIVCCYFVTQFASFAQPWKVYRSTRLAGSQLEAIGVPALEAKLPQIFTMGFGPNGELHFAVNLLGMLRLTNEGVIENSIRNFSGSAFSFAPNGGFYSTIGNSLTYTGPDGVSRSISLQGPWGSPQNITDVAALSDGRAYVADQRGRRIFLVDPQGNVRVIAGLGGLAALTGEPNRIAVDASDRLYIAYTSGAVVRVVQAEVTNLVSQAGLLGDIATSRSGDVFYISRGPAGVFRVSAGQVPVEIIANVAPESIAVDSQDRLVYLASGSRMILRREPDGTITRLAGDVIASSPGGDAFLPSPQSVVLGAGSDLYVSDASFKIVKLRRMSQQVAEFVSETPVSARPDLLVQAPNGTFYFAQQGGREVFRWRDGESAVSHATGFQNIGSLAIRDGQLLVADHSQRTISSVDAAGTIEPLPIQDPLLFGLRELVVSPEGEIIFRHASGSFYRVNRGNQVSPLPSRSFGDALAASECLGTSSVSRLARESGGSLLFTDGSALCRFEATGKVWLVAGRRNARGNALEGATGDAIRFGNITGLALGEDGMIYVSDSGNEIVRQLELVSDGPPYALQPEVVAVRGAGGSTAPAVTVLSPGGLISIFGRQFAPLGTARAVTSSDQLEGRLPTKLASTCVRIGEELAPLTFVGENQINAQVPNVPLGGVDVSVAANCGEAEEFVAAGLRVVSQLTSPEFLYWVQGQTGNNPVVAVDAVSGSFLGPAGLISGVTFRPAKSGDVVTIYAVGFGPTVPNPEPGASVSAPAPAREPVIVFLGGNRLDANDLLYAGASPGIAGLYQVNLRIPAIASGQQKLRIQVGSFSSPTDGYLLIQN